MLRVVIDPNVFVSAVITPDGVPAQIVRAALVREFQLVVSPALIGELVDVFARPKLRPYRIYAFEWGARVWMRGGDGRFGQVIPPVWSRTRSR